MIPVVLFGVFYESKSVGQYGLASRGREINACMVSNSSQCTMTTLGKLGKV